MAKDPQSKPIKRRPTKSRSPLQSVDKTDVKPELAKKPVKKHAAKAKTTSKSKKPVKKPIITNKTKSAIRPAKKTPTKKAKPKKVLAKKSKTTPQRKPVAKKPNSSQLISLPIGRGARLVLTVNRTKTKTQKPKPKKSTKSKQATQQAKLTKHQQLLISLAFLLTGLLGTAFFGMQAMASPTQPITTPTLVLRSKAPVTIYMPSSVPTTLRIPDIQLNTTITPVGLDKDGALIVPDNSNIAGWYDKSPTPGQKGPSVIDGHLDNETGIAVFWRLRELVPGQIVEIDRADGTTAKFAVDKVQSYSQSNFPTAEVYNNLNHSGLRLITCGGTFDKATGHYSENVIVFATYTKS